MGTFLGVPMIRIVISILGSKLGSPSSTKALAAGPPERIGSTCLGPLLQAHGSEPAARLCPHRSLYNTSKSAF